jgi:hypothetical protein
MRSIQSTMTLYDNVGASHRATVVQGFINATSHNGVNSIPGLKSICLERTKEPLRGVDENTFIGVLSNRVFHRAVPKRRLNAAAASSSS